jgi:hypothetical protein
MTDKQERLRVLVDVEGASVLVEPESGRMYHLTPTGAFVYQLIEKGLPQEEIVRSLCQEYEVDRPEAEADLETFRRSLQAFLDGAR